MHRGTGIAERLGDQRRWGELAAGMAVVLYFQGEFDRLADWEAEMAGGPATPTIRSARRMSSSGRSGT